MAELKDLLQDALGTAYRIEKELGGGGMSRVFLAQEVRLGRHVVVKVLPPEMAARVSVDRFEREIALAAKLQHPHIVPLLTAGSEGDLLYYIMPHIEGQSLRARLAHEKELPIGEAVRMLRDVCDALAHAHAQGIVHRDVKPDNVLLSGKHALVTDFGVSKAVQESTGKTALTSMGVALGTPAYMAPEQATADPNTDHRADIYAVGALAYEMLAGRPPFTGPTVQAVLAAQVTSPPDPVTKYRDSVPPALAALIMRCLAKHPADRWQWAGEILEQLEQMVTPTGGITPTGTAPYDAVAAAAAQRAHPLRVAGLFALASVAVLGVVYILVDQLGLPDWVMPGAVALLAIGLPIMVTTGLVERRRALARTTGRVAPPTQGLRDWFTWRKALTGGVLAFSALGVVAAGYTGMRVLGIGPVGTLVASGVLDARDRLVLADFENRTADTTLGPSVGEAFRIDLAQSPIVRLLDAAAVTQALQRMNRPAGTRLDLALARELAQREGAKAVVRGQIDPVGRGYVLAAELVSPVDGSVLVALRENAKHDGAIIDAVDRLSKRLRERIGESLKTIRASEPLERVTTASLEALRKYSQGVTADAAGHADRAVALLEEATGLDTAFAMAYRKMAVILFNTSAPPSRMAAAATKAYQYRDRLPPVERYLTLAYYYHSVAGDRERGVTAYRSVIELDPENMTPLNNLALLLNQGRDYAAAESLALRATMLSNAPPPMANLLRARVGQGKLEQARQALDDFERRVPGHPAILVWRARLAEQYRRYDSAETYVRRRLASPPIDLAAQSGAALSLFALHAVRGRLADAEAAAREFMAVSEKRGLPGPYIGAATELAVLRVRLRGDRAGARRVLEEAIARHPLTTIAATDRPHSALGYAYAELGELDRAKTMLAAYQASGPEPRRLDDAFRHSGAAAIALAEGRFEEAIARYRTFYDESGCSTCGLYELAQACERANQPDTALAVYERAASTPGWNRLTDEFASLGPLYKRLGELYEERGDVAKARDYYGRFVDLWKDADRELQPVVRDVRQRLSKLTGDRP